MKKYIPKIGEMVFVEECSSLLIGHNGRAGMLTALLSDGEFEVAFLRGDVCHAIKVSPITLPKETKKWGKYKSLARPKYSHKSKLIKEILGWIELNKRVLRYTDKKILIDQNWVVGYKDLIKYFKELGGEKNRIWDRLKKEWVVIPRHRINVKKVKGLIKKIGKGN